MLVSGRVRGFIFFQPPNSRERYKLVTGTGPTTGWVSISLKDKALGRMTNVRVETWEFTGTPKKGHLLLMIP